MARRVFFSFHYDDVMRVNVVRNSDQIVRQYHRAARFHDKSLWEQAKREGRLAIKRMINRGLLGSSVTCVLIGQYTWQRPWVRYEILKSFARGNGILAVQIHDVGISPKEPSSDFGRLLMELAPADPSPAPSYSRPHHGALFAPRDPMDELIAALANLPLADPPSVVFGPRPAPVPDPKDPFQELLDAMLPQPAAPRSSALFGHDPTFDSLFASTGPSASPSAISALGALMADVEASSQSPQPGHNPLGFVGYAINRASGSVGLLERTLDGRTWCANREIDRVALADLPWLSRAPDAGTFESLFRLYDWKRDDGAHALPGWIEHAARQVGR